MNWHAHENEVSVSVVSFVWFMPSSFTRFSNVLFKLFWYYGCWSLDMFSALFWNESREVMGIYTLLFLFCASGDIHLIVHSFHRILIHETFSYFQNTKMFSSINFVQRPDPFYLLYWTPTENLTWVLSNRTLSISVFRIYQSKGSSIPPLPVGHLGKNIKEILCIPLVRMF